MSDTLFVIAGGGTGAKVAEALIHVCAAGLGPRELHLLLVDADSSNGNLQRAIATAEVYQKMQRWPWSVQTTTGGKFFGLGAAQHQLALFATSLHVHQLTVPLDTTQNGGIANLAEAHGSRQMLDLLYDADEQQATAEDGFRARPNLGCLLLADHLDRHLERHAKPFLDALKGAAQRAEVVPVVVTASIFGGTGASLLPIARGSIEKALNDRVGGTQDDPAITRLRWAATMMLPHYQPTHRKESVDPERYLLDTSNALQFYGLTQSTGADLFHAIYAIGSDRPARNRVKPVLGQQSQANPPYVEEFVTALAALDATTSIPAGRAVYVYHPDRGQDRIEWRDLPLAPGARLDERMGYLLHLGAFYLRPADPYQPGLVKGLDGLLGGTPDDEIEQFAWYKHVLDPWATSLSPIYTQTPKGRRASALRSTAVLGEHSADYLRPAAVEYFARLHLWSAHALRDGDQGVLHLITHFPDKDYVYLQGEMARMNARDVDVPSPGGEALDTNKDNALARLLRTALAAEVNAHERTRANDGKIAGDFVLVEPNDGRIGLRVTVPQIEDALRRGGLGDLVDEYSRTAAEAIAA